MVYESAVTDVLKVYVNDFEVSSRIKCLRLNDSNQNIWNIIEILGSLMISIEIHFSMCDLISWYIFFCFSRTLVVMKKWSKSKTKLVCPSLCEKAA